MEISTKNEKREENIEKENDPLDIYKKTVLWSKLEEAMNEMKTKNNLTKELEEKINSKFNSFMFKELKNEKKQKNNNILKGKVSNYSRYNNTITFYCNDVNIKLKDESITIPELKIIGIDENYED